MFDGSLARPADLAGVSDVALIGAIAGWARAAAGAEARKLAAIAELERRRCGECEHPRWACDDLDAAAAEVSCALTIGHGRALGQIGLAVALRDRLPKVGARFLAGHLSPAMISTIVWRTAQVLDAVALARIDREIAEHAPDWGPLSQYKLEQAIDLWVERYDPDAVRRVRNTVRGRDFTVGHRDDTTGTASVYGRLTITDAVLLEQRIALMIASVCDDDPRTLGQRRADAVGAIAAGATHLMCRCENPTCAAKVDDGRASNVTIHIIGDHEALDAAQDQKMHGQGIDFPPARTPPAKSEPEPEPAAESEAHEPEPVKTEPVKTEPVKTEAKPAEPAEPPRPRTAALIPGAKGAIVPAPLLAELIAHGAKVRFVGAPSQCEDRYRPSTALQEFVRTRDLTCRFPGCDRPAVAADIDHTVPWPAGATHPANNKCYCRLHHLVKTFWDGWTDHQNPDGTIVVTTPTGLSYTTKPFSSLLFPQWNTTTPPPPGQQAAAPTHPGRHLMMPTRRRTRAQTRTARITAERHLNAAERAFFAAASTEPIRTRSADPTRDPEPHPYIFHPAGHIPDYGDDPPPF